MKINFNYAVGPFGREGLGRPKRLGVWAMPEALKHEIPGEAFHQVVLVGNPNVGKSVIFGALTGRYVIASNYPGTTVELSKGRSKGLGRQFLLIDTPGINSVWPRSEDEVVTRDVLLDNPDAHVIQIADAKNLERALFLTSQLAELGARTTLALNMWDEARNSGVTVDAKRLAEILGIPVIPTIATEKVGISQLSKSLDKGSVPSIDITYPGEIEDSIREIEDIIPGNDSSRRGISLMLLSGDETILRRLSRKLSSESIDQIRYIVEKTSALYADPLDYVISRIRARQMARLLEGTVTRVESRPGSIAETIGRVSSHPVYGAPIAAGVLYLMYLFVGVLGAGKAVDFIESVVFGEYINPAIADLFQLLLPEHGFSAFIQDLFVGEFGLISVGLTYSVAIVLPIVGFFFLAFGMLEDSGYLPRLAILANRLFKRVGLSGKAVLPIVLGFGCDTMATLTTRILDTKKERILSTLLLALAIPCSAQLGVIMGVLGQISLAAFVIFGTVIFSQFLIVGFLGSKLFRGPSSDFVIEIPPIRLPKPANVLAKTLTRVRWFFLEAVPLFLLGTFILFILSRTGALVTLERAVSPIVSTFLGLPSEAARAFLMGFLRRDYGAAGLYSLFEGGLLNPLQAIVSMVVITLFVPCIANLFVMIKERGALVALGMVAFIIPFSVLVGGVVRLILAGFGYGE
jgi:ferrous iron transport protein B